MQSGFAQHQLPLPQHQICKQVSVTNYKEHTAPSPGRRILIIEDNSDFAESLSSMLIVLGHEVVVETSGTTGLATARSMRSDVIICDIGLPDFSGIDFVKAL